MKGYRLHEIRVPNNKGVIGEQLTIKRLSSKALKSDWISPPPVFKAVRARGFFYE